MPHRSLLAVAIALTAAVVTTAVPAFGAPTPLEPIRVVDLTPLELDSLNAVLSADGELRLFDPRSSQMVAASLDGTLLHREQLQVGVPAHVIEVGGQFVRLGYERMVNDDGDFMRLKDERAKARGLDDGDAFWAPTTLSWRTGLDFGLVDGTAVDLTRSAETKLGGSLAYHIASVINFTVTSEEEHLMAVGTLIADGAQQDQLSVYSYRVTPDERPSPVTLHFPIFDRSAMVFYRVYNYIGETKGWAYLAVLDGTQSLYRWRPGQAPAEVQIKGDSPFGATLPYIDPMLPPRDLLTEIEAQEEMLTGLVASPTGNVFAVVRHPDGPQAARWNLIRLEPASDGSANMSVGATFELPTRAPEIALSASDDGRWLLFEKAPLTRDMRQPIETLIELDANIVENGHRNVKSPRGTTRR